MLRLLNKITAYARSAVVQNTCSLQTVSHNYAEISLTCSLVLTKDMKCFVQNSSFFALKGEPYSCLHTVQGVIFLPRTTHTQRGVK